jgi:ribose-phosphate pyrophosphokinase
MSLPKKSIPTKPSHSQPLSDIRIFSGSAHKRLGQEICDLLEVPLQPSHTERFHNENIAVHLDESVRSKPVFIIQPFCPPVSDNILELLMMLDAARRASAKEVHAVIPYYCYGRSDKKDEPRISITARLIADLLVTAGATHVITMALHSPQVQGFFAVPTDELAPEAILSTYFAGRDHSSTVVVAPDIGHAKRAAKFARLLGGLPVAAGNKDRIDDDHVHLEIIGDLRCCQHAIIIDDEIAKGTTVLETIKRLSEKDVKKFTVVCTHGVFVGDCIEKLGAVREIAEIVTTNTLPIPREKRLPHMHVLSVAPLFAEAIRRNYLGLSLGDLFAFAKESAIPHPAIKES